MIICIPELYAFSKSSYQSKLHFYPLTLESMLKLLQVCTYKLCNAGISSCRRKKERKGISRKIYFARRGPKWFLYQAAKWSALPGRQLSGQSVSTQTSYLLPLVTLQRDTIPLSELRLSVALRLLECLDKTSRDSALVELSCYIC
jgi:hypothetical protein